MRKTKQPIFCTRRARGALLYLKAGKWSRDLLRVSRKRRLALLDNWQNQRIARKPRMNEPARMRKRAPRLGEGRPRLNRIGERYCAFVIIARDGSNGTNTRWVCRCDCGKVFKRVLDFRHGGFGYNPPACSPPCVLKYRLGESHVNRGALVHSPVVQQWRLYLEGIRRNRERPNKHPMPSLPKCTMASQQAANWLPDSVKCNNAVES